MALPAVAFILLVALQNIVRLLAFAGSTHPAHMWRGVLDHPYCIGSVTSCASLFSLLRLLIFICIFCSAFLFSFIFISNPASDGSEGAGASSSASRLKDVRAEPLFLVSDFIGEYGAYVGYERLSRV